MLDFRPLLKEMSEIHAGSKYKGVILTRAQRLGVECRKLGRQTGTPVNSLNEYPGRK